MKKTDLLIFLLFTHASATAGQYYKCTDENGRQVFSQTKCGADATTVQTEGTNSIGSGSQGQLSATEQLEAIRSIGGGSRQSNKKKKSSNPCSGVTSFRLRNAVVKRDLMKCHSKSDVTKIYGSPDSTSSWPGGSGFDTQWAYHFRNNDSKYIYFKDGKVTNWSSYELQRR